MKKDKILAIVKSIQPINHLYSKQNKNYDRYFQGSRLKDLLKKFNKNQKFDEFLKLGVSLDEINNNKVINNINFQKIFKYIDDLSNYKKVPILNKNSINNIYHSENNNRKYTKNNNIKKKKFERFSTTKIDGDANVTMDPGRYRPKYDFIKKRSPCAFLGKPKNDDDDIKVNIEKNKNKKRISKNILKSAYSKNENSKSMICSLNKSVIEKSNKKEIESELNKTIKVNQKNKDKDKGKIIQHGNLSYYNLYNKNENKFIKLILHPKEKSINSLIKELNTSSNNSNDFSKINNNLFKAKNDNNKFNNINKTQRIYLKKRKKKNLIKNASMTNIKSAISFDKMQGRSHIFRKTISSRISYNPDYSYLRPHIPATIFKAQKEHQKFKKYVIGKIIRNYYYNSDRYFACDYKEDSDNEKTEKYDSLLLHF